MIVSFFRPHTVKKTGARVPGVLPLPYEFSWGSFVAYLGDCAGEPAPRSHKEIPTVEINALGMAQYSEGMSRGLEAALGADWIGLDIDDKGAEADAWKFDDLVDFLTQAGVAFAIYTTTSCTPERHCLRVILPFNRHVWAEEWSTVWAAFAGWIGQIDVKTKDLSRLLYEPRRWEGAYNRFHASPPGQPFVMVDDIVERYAPVIEAAPLPQANYIHAVPDLRMVGGLDDLETSPIIRQEWIDDACRSQEGGRMYSFLCKAALSARAQSIALSEFELSEIGRRLAIMIGRKSNSDIGRDAQRALNWASTANMEIRGNRHSAEGRLPPPWPWACP